jgi:hypothetical protein
VCVSGKQKLEEVASVGMETKRRNRCASLYFLEENKSEKTTTTTTTTCVYFDLNV